MSENNSTALASVEDVEQAEIETVLARTEGDPIAILREAYATAQSQERRHKGIMEAAHHAKQVAMVWQARIAYRAATAEGIATKATKGFNITGAAKALGVPVATFRPYALAGQALHQKDRAGILATPAKEDIAIVDGSFDAISRAQQKDKRLKEAAKKKALEAKALELEALKKANGEKAPQAPANGTKAPEGDKAPQAPAQAPQAPASDIRDRIGAEMDAALKAPAGPSLEDGVLDTARQLVAQVKLLRKDKGWAKVAPKVVAILTEVFPVLGK